MNTLLKRTLSLLLCLCMLFGMGAAAGAVTADIPVIYVTDISESRLYSEPNSASMRPVFLPEEEKMYEYFAYIIGGLLYATVGGKKEDGLDLMLKGVNGLLRDTLCDQYGESANVKIGANTYKYPLSYYKNDAELMTNMVVSLGNAENSVGLDDMYYFTYDWRMDPMENAAKLKDYIDQVKTREGVSKVSLIGAGYGGIIIDTYMYLYESHAINSLSSCVFLNSPLHGSSLVGDLMVGNLTDKLVDAESIMDAYETITAAERANAMVRYTNDDPYSLFLSLFESVFGESDEYVNALSVAVVWVVNAFLAEEDMWSDIGKDYNSLVSSSEDEIYGSYLGDFLRYTPGLWAMVPEEQFADAMFYMFPEDEISDKLEKKINDFRPVLAATDATLKKMHSAGINVCVVAGYNLQILPLTGTIDEHSDCTVLTRSASAGATCVKLGEATLNVTQAVEDGHYHLAPDATIDASTCALPENTWFIRNLPNMRFDNPSAANFVMWLVNSNRQRTVWEDGLYPQFQAYSRGKNLVYALDNGSKIYYYGDCNVDGHVDAADARLALRHSVGLEIIDTHRGQVLADVDTDGDITAADARTILRFAVGLDALDDEEA